MMQMIENDKGIAKHEYSIGQLHGVLYSSHIRGRLKEAHAVVRDESHSTTCRTHKRKESERYTSKVWEVCQVLSVRVHDLREFLLENVQRIAAVKFLGE